MTVTLTIARAAEIDLLEALVWYEEKEISLGTRFEENLTDAVQSILNNPLQFPVRYGETRVCFLKEFPYGIHYRIKDNHILIVAVFHTSRSPKIWEVR